MSGVRLTDEEIEAMSPQERRELIRRLAPGPPPGLLPSRRTIERIRHFRLALLLLSIAVLVPWTVYLAVTLPDRYVARNWVSTWVGFDIILVVMLALTAIAGWRRSQLLFPTGFAAGVLLVCDAWFDVLTSQAGDDRLQALLTAALIELPLAFVLIAGPLRILRYVAIKHGLVDPAARFWRRPIPLPESEDPAERL
ncbi:hypothetical protein [Kribbella amoyensis]|uniref:hypothetical protein n=1 Tax=Kribbella amoyensis TaxID=996641 RepID=UPI00192D79A4|nr:hypothetical protein [Kribbella amoyensis]